ncbi:MAG TPA: FkbM family methyltransferase [Humidesulfovibrio sp.]|uniref:FkbM family methyltransferase n=1 Tax=Humidesulfovibrio sp. TaxID=2910988 RepID=UPI002D1CEAB5|nr:FkbM family methyltransferase [Humidesulfovibrio sp.]HWR03254.1 FkbM family methyltransferase [Humidesulfovibrio sp.]
MRLITGVDQLPQGAAISIYGAGGAGRELLRQVRASGRVRATRFLDTKNSGELDGLPVLRFADYLREHPEGDGPIVIASSYDDEISWTLREAGLTDYCSFKDCGRYILCNLLCALLPEGERFTLLDIGARDAKADPRWLGLPPERMRLYGFELDEEGCAAMTREMSASGMEARFFPYGLWSEAGPRTFHFCPSHPDCSSFFPPDFAIFDRWKMPAGRGVRNEGRHMRPMAQETVTLSTLDRWRAEQDVASVDFMKLNVQGAELEILGAGESVLPEAVGLLTEVAFVEDYTGRPLFADVDRWLRGKGFTFFEFISPLLVGRNASPVSTRLLPGYHHWHGQRVESHALYLRDPIALERQGADLSLFRLEKVLKLAALAERYFQVEFAFEVVLWFEGVLRGRGETAQADTLRDAVRTAALGYQNAFGA